MAHYATTAIRHGIDDISAQREFNLGISLTFTFGIRSSMIHWFGGPISFYQAHLPHARTCRDTSIASEQSEIREPDDNVS